MTTKFYTLAETALEKHVARWIDRYEDHGYEKPADLLKDLFYGGCISGMVGHLIYYRDTLAFYRKHRAEIDRMYSEAMREYGSDFRLNGWDNDDPLARDTTNRNILAWFGFEETARNLANKAGLDL
jgi:hypothetical protein